MYSVAIASGQKLDVEQVLGPATRSFVAEQLVSPEKRNRSPLDGADCSRWPCVFERDAADPGEEVDPPGRQADLADGVGCDEVLATDVEGRERSAKAHESLPDPLGIRRVGLNPEIEIPGCTGGTMDRNGMCSDDQENRAGLEECIQQVEEVLVQGQLLLGPGSLGPNQLNWDLRAGVGGQLPAGEGPSVESNLPHHREALLSRRRSREVPRGFGTEAELADGPVRPGRSPLTPVGLYLIAVHGLKV